MYDTEDQSICVDIENLDENMSIQNGPERNLYIAIVVRAIQDWGSKDLSKHYCMAFDCLRNS